MIIPQQLKLTKKVLHQVARPVYPNDDPRKVKTLCNMMHDFMLKNDGIGLAAPQVGISRRILVMNINGVRRTCINPEAHDATTDQTMWYEEGCLSFPGETVRTCRPRKIWARYQDETGQWYEEEMSELTAICYQHELDHLNGIVMHDRKADDSTDSPTLHTSTL
jgi:peptide deformylase